MGVEWSAVARQILQNKRLLDLSWSSFILLHGGSERKSGTIAQPLTSQYLMCHQISPPQPFALRPSREVADNRKLWKEKYNNYFVISGLDRESYTEGEDSNIWRVVMAKMQNTELEKSMRSTSDTVLTRGIYFQPSRSIVLMSS